MSKKFNPALLKEELERFKNLFEYDFYQEKKEAPEYKELLLGDIEEEDEPIEKDGGDIDAAADSIGDDLGVDPSADDMGGEDMGGEEPAPEATPAPAPAPEPASDDVEIDVTSLVQGSEDAKKAADHATHNTEILLQKLNDLESQISSMDKIGMKIEDLEKEIIKRNPTPVEKLEMRSLDSYPFNQKLSDYWAEKEGPYDVMDKKDKEYVLTQKDIDDTYSDAEAKKSFSVDFDEEDVNDYDEEDI